MRVAYSINDERTPLRAIRGTDNQRERVGRWVSRQQAKDFENACIELAEEIKEVQALIPEWSPKVKF